MPTVYMYPMPEHPEERTNGIARRHTQALEPNSGELLLYVFLSCAQQRTATLISSHNPQRHRYHPLQDEELKIQS